MKQFFLLFLAILSYGISAQDLKLLPPQTSGGTSLREALENRRSEREYTGAALSEQMLSNLFHAICGINRKASGKWTIPTARNAKDLIVFAATEQGIYRYEPENHFLKQIKQGDYRSKLGMQQEMFSKAAVVLIYASDLSKLDFCKTVEEKKFYAGVHAGFAMQNAGLFCAAEKLGNVVIGSYDRKNVPELLNTGTELPILMVQLVGILK